MRREQIRRAERVARVHATEVVQHERDQSGPPGLVTGPDAGAVVAVEILVEQQTVAPSTCISW